MIPEEPHHWHCVCFPAERALFLYLIFAAGSIVMLRPPSWAWLSIGHLTAAGLVWWISRKPIPASRQLAALQGIAPVLTFAVLYPLTGKINIGLSPWILDGPLERFEASLFMGQPSILLAERASWIVLSEFLHACYFSYYMLVAAMGIVLILQKRLIDLSRAVGVLCYCFFFCLICYIWIPVTSPLYLYAPIGSPLSNGFFYRLTHQMAVGGGVVGGAFPSSHAALSTLNLLLAYKLEKRLFFVTLLPTIGLLVGTVYCRYHYALDTIVGMLVAFVFFWLWKSGGHGPLAGGCP